MVSPSPRKNVAATSWEELVAITWFAVDRRKEILDDVAGLALKSAGSTAKHVEIPTSMTSVINIVLLRNGHVFRGFIVC